MRLTGSTCRSLLRRVGAEQPWLRHIHHATRSIGHAPFAQSSSEVEQHVGFQGATSGIALHGALPVIDQAAAKMSARQRDIGIGNSHGDDEAEGDKFDRLLAAVKYVPTPARRRPRKRSPSQVLRMARFTRVQKKQDRPSINRVMGDLVHLSESSRLEDRAERRRMFSSWKKLYASSLAWIKAGPKSSTANLPERTENVVLTQLLELSDVEAMRTRWLEYPAAERMSLWTSVMMDALIQQPDKARLVLEATFEEYTAPAYAVQDVMHYLVRRLQWFEPKDRRAMAEDIASLMGDLVTNTPQHYFRFSQNTIYALLVQLDVERLKTLFEQLRRAQHRLHHYTELQFAIRFAREANFKHLGMRILKSLVKRGTMDINSTHLASLCTALLSSDPAGDAVRMRAGSVRRFKELLELGLNPNVITYTTIIRNLCLNKELEKAWQVYEIMVQHEIEPDAFTYSILMHGSKIRGDTRSMLRAAQLAHEKGVTETPPWNDLIHVVYGSAIREARRRQVKRPRALPVFGPMLRVYQSIFDMEPLQRLIPFDLEGLANAGLANPYQWEFVSWARDFASKLPRRETREILTPSGDTLGLMLVGYIRGLSQPYDIVAFYSHFRNLLQSGNQVVRQLVEEQGSLVHDIVIMALTERREMLRVAFDVVGDMLRDAAESPITSTHRQLGEGSAANSALPRLGQIGRAHPAPSVYTWSILLNSLMFHRQLEQGERILAMMRSHGIEPSVVTWNTLVAGYARLQMVKATAGALQRLERAGLTANDFTIRAFSYLQSRDAALKYMEGIIQQKKERLEAMARQDADGKLGAKGAIANHAGITRELRQLESEVDRIANTMSSEEGTADDSSPGHMLLDDDEAASEVLERMRTEIPTVEHDLSHSVRTKPS